MVEQKLDVEEIEPLSDEPVEQDNFKGQSHDNVAEALVKLISKNEGGYAIGLEGSWGSGKSTVINIAENKLEDKGEEILFFPFDTWARQGDPIRRSFLELLIKFLSDNEIINRDNWVKTLKEIQSRTQEETKYSKPSFTRFGKMMGVYSLLFPFLVILTRVVSTNSSFEITVFYILYVSILIPTLLIIIEKNIQWYLGEEKNDSLVPSIRLSHHKISTEQFIREKDTTTIEFNRYFDDLVNKIVEKGKRLVVVIDNLDRLSPDAIKSIWATMRNFFTSESWGERYKLLKNVYLIVPYDRNYISTIFSAAKESERKNGSSGEVLQQNNRSESGFIDKTFKLSFQVSPPILSHWKSFFFEQLDNSFNNQLRKSQKHDIYKLFEFRFQNIGETITPRSIKKFVNSLVVQVIEWENKIPIKFLALYVLHKDDISLNYRKFVENKVLDQRTRNYLKGDDWAKYLAAAYHKVDPESALQISLGQSIKNALVNGRSSDLEDMQNNDWFASTLNFVIEENCKNWASSEPDTYSTVASTLSKVHIENEFIEQNIWDDLAKNISSFTNIEMPTEKLAEGIKIIIENASEHLLSEAGKNIYKPIRTSLNDDIDQRALAADYFDYISITYSALEKRLGDGFPISFLRNFRLPNKPKFLIYFASDIFGFKSLNLRHFRLNESVDDITQEVRSSISNDNIFNNLTESIKGFTEAKIELDWKAIAQEIQSRIRNNKPTIAGRELGDLIYTLLLLEKKNKGNSNSILSKLVSDGVMISLFGSSNGDSYTEAVVLLKIIHEYEAINSIPTNNNVPTYGNNNASLNSLKEVCQKPEENIEVVQKMSEIACELEYFQPMLNAATVSDEYELPKYVVSEMIQMGCINGIIIDLFIEEPGFIKVIAEGDNSDSFFELVDKKEFDLDLINSLENISIASLQGAIETDSQLGDQLVEKIKEDLANLDPEEWDPILEEGSHEIELLFTIIEHGNISFLSEDFSQSLLDNSVKTLEEEIAFPAKRDEWYLLPKALRPKIRDPFYERLYSKLVSYNKEQAFELIKLFGGEFLASVEITEEADLFTKNIVSMLVNRDDMEMLEWTKENISIVQECYENSTENTQDYIIEILNTKEDENEDVKNEIQEIAAELGIKLKWNGEEEE